nr:hypothetical protein [Kibdelosporangium sp. MJ126-NF4]
MAHRQSTALAALLTLGLTACTNQEQGQDNPTLAVEKNVPAKAGPTPLLLAGTARMYNVPPEATGWAQLQAGKAGALNPVLTDATGRTLYRSDEDSANPPQSTCEGDCAAAWPPVTVAENGRIFLEGVTKSDVGVARRTDGKLQITIAGWPIYRYAKDTKPGEASGHGVGTTWFGVTPSGEKADSTVLFDEPGFANSEAKQAVAPTQGCQNLEKPNRTSSVSTAAWTTLWTERNCKGRSVTIKGKIADLTTANFDNKTASVSFE